MKSNHAEHLAWYRNTIEPSLLASSQLYTIYKADDPSTHTVVSNNYSNRRDNGPINLSTNTTESTVIATPPPSLIPTAAVRKRPMTETTDAPSLSPNTSIDLSGSRNRLSLSCKRSRNERQEPSPPVSTIYTNNRNVLAHQNTSNGFSDPGYDDDDDFDLDDALMDEVINFEANKDAVMKEASSSSSPSITSNNIPTSGIDNRPSSTHVFDRSFSSISSSTSTSTPMSSSAASIPKPQPSFTCSHQDQEPSRRPLPGSFTRTQSSNYSSPTYQSPSSSPYPQPHQHQETTQDPSLGTMVVAHTPKYAAPLPASTPTASRNDTQLVTKDLEQQLANLQQKQTELAGQLFRTSDPDTKASLLEEGQALATKIDDLKYQIDHREPTMIDLVTLDDMDIDNDSTLADDLTETYTAPVPITSNDGGATVASPYFPSSSSSIRTVAATTTKTTTATPEPERFDTYDSQSCIMAAPTQEPNYPWSKDVRHTLRQVFKLAEFRLHQLEAINTTMKGEDVFVLMPTGGGKSLCYQLPATLQQGFYGSTKCPCGVTIVVSPLLSLMVDQVEQLQRRGIQAERLDGTITAEHRAKVFQSLNSYPQPTLQLVYVTPEMISQSGFFQDTLDRLYKNDRLARFVIDEAHCVSQWGHDFRPDYKQLVKLKTNYPTVPLMALTATANLRVEQDVMVNLGISGSKVFKQSFNRPNLKYEIVQLSLRERTEDIYRFITGQFRNQCGIIYCSSRDKTEMLAEELGKRGLRVSFYHAGLSNEQRTDTQQKWQQNIYQVIVATVAFGMGIDKPDVRFVVHHTLPRSVEGYYQETGRAGRDGKNATCRLYYTFGDTMILQRLIKQNTDASWQQKQYQLANLQAMINYCQNPVDCRRKLVLAYFGENFDPLQCTKSPATICDNCANTRGKQVYDKDMTKEAKLLLQLYQQLQAIPNNNYNNYNNNDNSKTDITLAQLISVFRGSNSQINRNRGYTEVEHFGAGKQMGNTNLNVTRLAEHLCANGYLQQYAKQTTSGFTSNYIELGSKAHALLSGKDTVHLQEIVGVKGSSSSTRQSNKPSTGTSVGTRYYPPGQSPQESRYTPVAPRQETSYRPTTAPHKEAHRSSPAPSTTPFNIQQYALPRSAVARTRHTASPSASATMNDPPDVRKLKEECFMEMRTLRGDVKRKYQLMQPSTVFSDNELKLMAKQLPDSLKRFAEVTGIDDEKYDRYGMLFLKVCKKYAEKAAEISKRPDQGDLD